MKAETWIEKVVWDKLKRRRTALLLAAWKENVFSSNRVNKVPGAALPSSSPSDASSACSLPTGFVRLIRCHFHPRVMFGVAETLVGNQLVTGFQRHVRVVSGRSKSVVSICTFQSYVEVYARHECGYTVILSAF